MKVWAKQRDDNERGIIDALEAAGAEVTQLDKGLDLLVAFRGAWFILEVKNPTRKKGRCHKNAVGVEACTPGGEWADMGVMFGPRAKMLFLTQARWIRRNHRQAGVIAIVMYPHEALAAIGATS